MTTTTDAADIQALQDRFWEAVNARDAGALAAILDDDFVFVAADGLERAGKADFITDVEARSEDEKVLRFELAGRKVQALGDMAVAYAHFHVEVDLGGEPGSTSGNAIEVFVRRRDAGAAGAWKVAGSVLGEIPPHVE